MLKVRLIEKRLETNVFSTDQEKTLLLLTLQMVEYVCSIETFRGHLLYHRLMVTTNGFNPSMGSDILRGVYT